MTDNTQPLISVVRGKITGHVIEIGTSSVAVAVDPVPTWCVVASLGKEERVLACPDRETALVNASDAVVEGAKLIYVEPEERETMQ